MDLGLFILLDHLTFSGHTIFLLVGGAFDIVSEFWDVGHLVSVGFDVFSSFLGLGLNFLGELIEFSDEEELDHSQPTESEGEGDHPTDGGMDIKREFILFEGNDEEEGQTNDEHEFGLSEEDVGVFEFVWLELEDSEVIDDAGDTENSDLKSWDTLEEGKGSSICKFLQTDGNLEGRSMEFLFLVFIPDTSVDLEVVFVFEVTVLDDPADVDGVVEEGKGGQNSEDGGDLVHGSVEFEVGQLKE